MLLKRRKGRRIEIIFTRLIDWILNFTSLLNIVMQLLLKKILLTIYPKHIAD